MFCTVCAVANPGAAHTCRSCGGRLERPATGPGGRSMRSDGVRRYRAIALIVAPLVALLAVGISYQRAEQTARARSYAQAERAAAAGDYALAIAAFAGAAGYRDTDARLMMLRAGVKRLRGQHR